MARISGNAFDGKHLYLLEYRNEIRKGNIVAGQELITQLDNLIEDLGNPAYVYDTRDAEFRVKFIETFCKHTKSPYFGEPFILELWQKAFIEAFYSFKWTDQGYYDYYSEKPPKKHLRRFKKAILLVARKNGKPLCENTRVKTPSGYTLLKDLKVGDYVCDENLNPTKVVGTTETMVGKKCYELVFEDGERIVAAHDHIWTVYTRDGGLFNVPTDMLFYKFLEKDGAYRYSVPQPWDGTYKTIVNVLHAESVPVRCIEVEAKSGLFVVQGGYNHPQ